MIKHFVKTLLIFIGMIIIGLVGVFLVSHFNSNENGSILPTANVAK